MSDMKCPICGSKLSVFYGYGEELFSCSNLTCKAGGFYATDNMWQELIRTRKALDVAKKALRELKDVIACPPDISYETGVSMYADGALQEITALEQKDVKC